MMYAASLPKIAILLGALVEAETGRMPLDVTRLQAMTRMIRYSSNEDATRVLDWVGGERLLEILQSPRFRLYDSGAERAACGSERAMERRWPTNGTRSATCHTALPPSRSPALLPARQRPALSPELNALMKETLSNPAFTTSS